MLEEEGNEMTFKRFFFVGLLGAFWGVATNSGGVRLGENISIVRFCLICMPVWCLIGFLDAFVNRKDWLVWKETT